MPGITRRSYLRKAAAAGSALLTAACGRAPGDQPAPAKVTGTTEFWQWATVYNPGMQTLTDEFNARKTGVTVNYVPAAGDYWNKLTAALAGNVGPDVFLMNTNARSWWFQGQLRELTDLLNKDKPAARDHAATPKAYDEWYRIEGKLTGWPWDYSAITSQFNLAHLEAAGLKSPLELGDKWNWPALLEYAQKLTRRGATPQDSRYGFIVITGDESGWLNFVYANGGNYFTPDLKRSALGQPPAVEAIEFLAELVTRHRVAPTADEIKATGRNTTQLFHQGLASMTSAGDWTFSDNKKVEGLRWEVSFIPKSPRTGKTGNTANLRALVLSAQSKRPEPTWEFMRFMLTRPVQDRVVALFETVPARADSAGEFYASPEKAGPPQGRRLLKESLQATRPTPAHYKAPLPEYRGQITTMIADIINGKVSVRDGMKQVDDFANAVFAKYVS